MIVFGAFVQCFLLLLGAGTIAIITLAIVGRFDPTRPLCTACRAPVPATVLVSEQCCPACGASLAHERAVKLKRRVAGAPVWIGVAIVALLWVALFTVPRWISRRAGGGAVGALVQTNPTATTPTDQLVAAAAVERAGMGGYAAEVLRRAAEGTLDVKVARTALLKELATLATAGQTFPGTNALLVAVPILEANPNDPELLDALINATVPAPQSTVTRANGTITLEIQPLRTRMSLPDRALQPIVLLRRITVNGEPASVRTLFRARQGGDATEPMLILHRPHRLTVSHDALDRATEIVLEIEAMLFDTFDAERMAAAIDAELPRESWPSPMATQSRRLVIPLTAHEPTIEPAPSDDGSDAGAETP